MKKILLLIVFALTSVLASAQFAAVRVNALGLATGTVNAGIDVTVSDRWTVDVSGYWNPIKTNNFRSNILAGIIGAKRWRFQPHVGMFYGINITSATYKVGNSNTRYNGWTVGIGGSVGYSWMLSTRWNFSLEGGAGFFYMKDTKYDPQASQMEDTILYRNKRIVFAPSKVEASFSFLF